MFNRLISFLQRNDILYNYQFGFRKNHSTSLALIDAADNIYQNLDASQTVVGVYLDLTKAFSTVNHDILLYKLQNYGIQFELLPIIGLKVSSLLDSSILHAAKQAVIDCVLDIHLRPS